MLRRRPQRSFLLGLTVVVLGFSAAAQAAPSAHVSAVAVTADRQPPSVPQGMAFAGRSRTTVRLRWNAARDNVAVAGYRLFRNGVSVATVRRPGYVYRGLRCGRRYTFALEAYDAAGNASNRAEATGSISTSACAVRTSPKPKPAPRTPAPPPETGPTPTEANLWVDATGGTCARRATRGAYADGQACTWNAAYRAAQTGDLILVRGGNYGDVTIGPNKPSIGPPGVTFRTVAGESVVTRDFENGYYNGRDGGNNITFVGPLTARTFRSDQTNNIVVDRFNVDCNGCVNVQTFHLEDNNNVVVRNSEIHDNTDNSLMWISGSNLTFENNRIHDAGLRPGSGAHTECMYAWRVTNLTLKRNHFWHCSVMDVFITGGETSTGGFVENNVFERPWEHTGKLSGGYAFHFRNGGSPSPDPNDWEFRYNTFVGGLSVSPGENPVGPGGMRVTGNVFLSASPCGHANATYAYNAFAGRGCGSHAYVFGLTALLAGFASTADPGDYSLRAGSVLRGKGNPDVRPAVDRAGRPRAAGKAPDLGAYEFG